MESDPQNLLLISGCCISGCELINKRNLAGYAHETFIRLLCYPKITLCAFERNNEINSCTRIREREREREREFPFVYFIRSVRKWFEKRGIFSSRYLRWNYPRILSNFDEKKKKESKAQRMITWKGKIENEIVIFDGRKK